MPQVSVVMPAYNAEKYIAEAFNSLISQTFSDWECIVINDGSTDQTLSIIKRYAAKESRIRYESIENSGSAKIPRDKAIELARSEWILALDADDYLASDVLAKLVDRQKQTDADIVLLKLECTEEDGSLKNFSIPSNDFDYNQILSGKAAVMLTVGNVWTIPCNGLINKRIYDARDNSNSLNHMNADEYDSRVIILSANRLALVNVEYYYRSNNNSITKKPTSKVFENLITNRMLVDLFKKKFGVATKEFNIVKNIYLQSIVGAFIRYGRLKSKMTQTERAKAKELLLQECGKVSFREIQNSTIPIKYKIINILPNDVQSILGMLYSKIR